MVSMVCVTSSSLTAVALQPTLTFAETGQQLLRDDAVRLRAPTAVDNTAALQQRCSPRT